MNRIRIVLALVTVGGFLAPQLTEVNAAGNVPIIYSLPSTLSAAGLGAVAAKADGTVGYFKAGTGFQKLSTNGATSTIGGSSVPAIYYPSTAVSAFVAGGSVFVGGSSSYSFSTPSSGGSVLRRESSGASLLSVTSANSAVGLGDNTELQNVFASSSGQVYATTFEADTTTCITKLFKLNSTPTFELVRTYEGDVSLVEGEYGPYYSYDDCVTAREFAVDGAANVYAVSYTESGTRLMKWSSSNVLSPVNDVEFTGYSVVSDTSGNLFYVDAGVIKKLSTSGSETVIAGTGIEGYSGDGGAASVAKLGYVTSLRVAPTGDLYFVSGFELLGQSRSVLRRIKMNPLLPVSAGKQVSSTGMPSSAIAADVEIATSGTVVTVGLKTPTKSSGTTGTQREVISYSVTLNSQASGIRNVVKSVTTSSARAVSVALTGVSKGKYIVEVTAKLRNGSTSTWVGPKITL